MQPGQGRSVSSSCLHAGQFGRFPPSVRGGRGRLGAAGGSLRARCPPAAWSRGGRAADRALTAPLTRKCYWARPPGSQPITSRGGGVRYKSARRQRSLPPCQLRARRLERPESPERPARRVGAGRMRGAALRGHGLGAEPAGPPGRPPPRSQKERAGAEG